MTAALKCGRQPSRNKTQSLPGQFLASLRYHRVSIESGSKAWMHFLIFFFTHSASSVYLSVLLSQSLTDNLATSKRMRVRWLVILLRLTEMERVATRIVRASPNGKIPHVKLAEKKKKHIFVWSIVINERRFLMLQRQKKHKKRKVMHSLLEVTCFLEIF